MLSEPSSAPAAVCDKGVTSSLDEEPAARSSCKKSSAAVAALEDADPSWDEYPDGGDNAWGAWDDWNDDGEWAEAWDTDGENEADVEDMERYEESAKQAVAEKKREQAEAGGEHEAEEGNEGDQEHGERGPALRRLEAHSCLNEGSSASVSARPPVMPAPAEPARDDDETINSTTHKKEYMRLVAWLHKELQQCLGVWKGLCDEALKRLSVS